MLRNVTRAVGTGRTGSAYAFFCGEAARKTLRIVKVV